MRSVRRLLPYQKQPVLFAVYDVLDSEKGYYTKEGAGCISAEITVFGNTSGFEITVSEEQSKTVLSLRITAPREGLSEKGRMRALCYLADRVEQLLENEIKLSPTSYPA